MYNLIVGAVDGVLGAERLLEDIEDGLESYVGPRTTPNVGLLTTIPTLLMPEIGDLDHAQNAQVGTVVSLSRSGRTYTFNFVRNVSVPLFHLSTSRMRHGCGCREPCHQL
jgi:hypothetical protein